MTRRIALVTTALGVVSGVTVFMEVLARNLQQRDYEVDLVRPEAHSFSSVPELNSTLAYAFLRETVRGYDLVMGNGVGLVAAVDLPVTLIDNIHSTAAGANAALEEAFLTLDKTEIYWLDVALGNILSQTVADIPAALSTKRTSFEIDAIVAQHAQEIITVSPANRDQVMKYFEVPIERITVVPNGIEEFWLQDRSIVPLIADHRVNVVYTGRAGHSTIDMFLKGIDRILYVLGEVKNAHPVGLFHLASKNKELLYATMLRDRGIDYHFNIQNSELQHYLRAGDIYIHTSRYESCSLSLMEAMASGLVPVSFPAGMAPIQIQNGVNGYIVNSVEEMVQCVQELITDPEKRTSLGAAATETIRAEYSIEKMVSGYIASFERLLS